MARRGQNEGSIAKRKDGRWIARFTIGYEGGKQRRKCVFYGKTRVEVQEKLTAALRNRQLGLPVTSDKITFGQYMERWLEESAKPGLRPRTYVSYEQLIRVHVAPVLGSIKLAKLSPGDIQTLYNRKLNDGLSPSSVRKIHAVIRRSLEVAYKWQLVPRNAATLTNPPRTEHFEVKPLLPEQARAFLEAVKGDKLEALYTVAMALGLRRGEILALRWEGIDLEAGTLRVSHTL